MKSNVTFISEPKEGQEEQDIPPYVTRYSSRGFRIKNVKVFGFCSHSARKILSLESKVWLGTGH